MTALLPEDPVAFVARAEKATNDADVDWAMNVYAPSTRLETYGDGLLDVHDGTDAVRKAVTTLYGWLQAIDGHIQKTFVAASGDALVNHWNGSLFGGRHTSYGAEFWYFDDTGHVVRNVLYVSLDRSTAVASAHRAARFPLAPAPRAQLPRGAQARNRAPGTYGPALARA